MSDVIAPPREGIAAAAAWWASRLGTVPESLSVPRPCRYSDDERERFRVALEAAISANLRGGVPALQAHPKRAPRYSNHRDVVEFDYDPDDTLCAAAEAAGIRVDWTSLPRKTLMILRESEIAVSEGYGAPYEAIWPSTQEGVEPR